MVMLWSGELLKQLRNCPSLTPPHSITSAHILLPDLHLLAQINMLLIPSATATEHGLLFSSLLLMWWAWTCSDSPIPVLTLAVLLIYQVQTELKWTKNFASDGSNSQLSSLLLVILRLSIQITLMLQALLLSITQLERLLYGRLCVTVCNTSASCIPASLRPTSGVVLALIPSISITLLI